MARSDAERLRELVNDRYHGLITPQSYRGRRAELLDNLGKTVDEPADITARPRSAPEPREEIKTVAPAPGEAPPGVKSGSKRVAFAGLTALVVGAAVLVLMIRSPETDSIEEADSPASVVGNASRPGDVILEEFLSRNEWSEDSLDSLLVAWGALDNRQRANASEGRLYRRLTGRLHQRIREEAAFDSGAPGPRLQAMTEFATRIGAPYPAIAATATQPDSAGNRSTQGSADTVDTTADSDDVSIDVERVPGEPTVVSRVAAQEPIASEPSPEMLVQDSNPIETAQSPVETATDSSPEVNGDDPCPAALANSRRPYCQDSLALGVKGPPLVLLRSGTFIMGSDVNDSESPVHEVSIGGSIAMSRDEISVSEFELFCEAMAEPCPEAPWDGDDYPVVSVSWDDANRFVQWLTAETGYLYRLPTEAEWEYAARAGTQTPFSFGDEVTPSAAHSSANGPVDVPLPRSNRSVNRNQFRLYHMSGNVREWVQDAWYPSYEGAPTDGSARLVEAENNRVVRGGSYSDLAKNLRSAARHVVDRAHEDPQTGFRVVREVNQASY